MWWEPNPSGYTPRSSEEINTVREESSSGRIYETSAIAWSSSRAGQSAGTMEPGQIQSQGFPEGQVQCREVEHCRTSDMAGRGDHSQESCPGSCSFSQPATLQSRFPRPQPSSDAYLNWASGFVHPCGLIGLPLSVPVSTSQK